MRFAKEAWPFVLPVAALGGVLALLRRPTGALGALVASGLTLLFFRDPPRDFGGDAGIIVAPADGVISRIDEVEDPHVGPGTFTRISTFLSVLDVHVQRMPVGGEVVAAQRFDGHAVNAMREDASTVNGRQLTVIRRTDGGLDRDGHSTDDERIGVYQIVGLIARRIVCFVGQGDRRQRGDHLGLIRFGSRVDLLIPTHYELLVRVGDRLRNGETPVALPTRAADDEPPADAA
ncbi:MAG: phosphatidylserine decarboxylase [Acidobacteriota bacterium]